MFESKDTRIYKQFMRFRARGPYRGGLRLMGKVKPTSYNKVLDP